MGCIAFSPLAQGMLSDKYINKIPKISRANEDSSLNPKLITKYEPLAWVLFIALTAVVGCPLF